MMCFYCTFDKVIAFWVYCAVVVGFCKVQGMDLDLVKRKRLSYTL